MKKFAIGVFVILNVLAKNTQAQKALDPFKSDNLFGKIKEVTEDSYVVKENPGGSVKTDSLIRNIMKYDSTGSITERIYYSTGRNNDFQFNTRFVYQKKMGGGDSVVVELYTNKKDADLYFDKTGKIIEFNAYDDKRALWYKNIYKYDKKGRLAKNEEYDQKGDLQRRVEFKYNNAGFVAEENSYSTNSNHIKIHYTYTGFDETGNWIKRTKVPELDNGTLSRPFYTERKIVYY